MNLFILDSNPMKAARDHCDRHVVKMILETAQLLSTAHRVLDQCDDVELYKATHINHPCAKWVRECSDNYLWAYHLFIALCDEYKTRYGKIHVTDTKLRSRLARPPRNIKYGIQTPFVLAMPEECKVSNPVASYRLYYLMHKAPIATWKTQPPTWWTA